MLGALVAQQTVPLGERLLVAATGPLITVLIGGLVVWAITTKIQRKREAADKALQHAREDDLRARDEARADLVRAQDTARADDALRHELVTAMTESAGKLYLLTQHYWRAKKDASLDPHDKGLADVLVKMRDRLDAQYLESRAIGQVVEARLEGYFTSGKPRNRWHQVMDLLTVRYFQLVDRDTQKLYEDNEGEHHTGLNVQQMRNPKTLLTAYHRTLNESVRVVFEEELRARS